MTTSPLTGFVIRLDRSELSCVDHVLNLLI